jgi:hypothetical protein
MEGRGVETETRIMNRVMVVTNKQHNQSGSQQRATATTSRYEAGETSVVHCVDCREHNQAQNEKRDEMRGIQEAGDRSVGESGINQARKQAEIVIIS